MQIHSSYIPTASKKCLAGLLFCMSYTAFFAQECGCKASFEFVRQKVEQSYSGFSQKVTQQTRAEYEQHTQIYQMKANSAKDGKQCFALYFEWMKWFKDPHLQIGPDLAQRTIRPDSDFSLSKLDSQWQTGLPLLANGCLKRVIIRKSNLLIMSKLDFLRTPIN